MCWNLYSLFIIRIKSISMYLGIYIYYNSVYSSILENHANTEFFYV